MNNIAAKLGVALSLLVSPVSATIPEVAELSLEQKIGQLFVMHFHGNLANNDAKTLIEDVGVGGIIYFNWANDLSSPKNVYLLSHSLQQMASKASAVPLLIAVDQEGGLVARLRSGFTEFPGNRALGETGKPELARLSALAMGQELQAVGINMNLAPVVDVNSNPLNPVIGIRSFGGNPEEVTSFGKEALKGYNEAGIITSLKHFPGHGDTSVDSHIGLPILNKSLDELTQVELVPFKNLQKYADAIMTAHLMIPSLDPVNCATLSKDIVQGLLREKIGFKGVIVTDSLIMQGVLDNAGSVNEAAVRALQAGNDLLILGGRQSLEGDRGVLEVSVDDVKKIQKYIASAVQEGRLSIKRIDEAVERVFALKKSYLKEQEDSVTFNEGVVHSEEHLKLAQRISTLSVRVLFGKESLPIEFLNRKVLLVAPALVKSEALNSTLAKLGKGQESYFFQGLAPTKEDMEGMKKLADLADITVFLSYNAWKIPGQKDSLEQLLLKKAPLVLVALRDPEDAALAKGALCALATYSPTSGSIEAAGEHLGTGKH